MSAVELTTARLRLRPWQLDDFDALAAFLADDDLARFRNGPVDGAGAWEFMAARNGEWTLRGYGGLAITQRHGGAVVGMAGLFHPAHFAEPELFWSLFAGQHGQGFATEAADAVRNWANIQLGLPPLMSFVHPDNGPSRRVAERLGATIEGDGEYFGAPRLIYRHRVHPTSGAGADHSTLN